MTTTPTSVEAMPHHGSDEEPGHDDRPARLLVVDDQEDNRLLVARRLRRHGFFVETADDGYSALELLQSGSFDLILLDVRMPGMDGHEVLRRIRKRYSIHELPVVMVSALAGSETVVHALELGANDYVTEPIDFDVALARIHNLLRSSAAAVRASLRPPEPPSRIEEGSVIDGRYRLERMIGAGGFAKVYQGTQLSTGQRVAVKVLQAGRWQDLDTAHALRRRFELEMQLIGGLAHPNVVRLLDSGTVLATGRASSPPRLGSSGIATRAAEPTQVSDQGQADAEGRLPYLVMELLEGETLEAKLDRNGKLSVQETIDLMLPVISGVGAAHAAGAIHRDLKPANIFLANESGQLQPKVLDFGIAKLVDRMAGTGLTQTAALIGTPEYMAPEQTCGKLIDMRCDQFTLASVLFECVTGRRAFEGNSVIDTVRRVYLGEFPSLPDELPAAFRDSLLRAGAVDPEDRYPTVEDLGLALLNCAPPGTQARWARSLRDAAERTGRGSVASDDGDPVSLGTAATSRGSGEWCLARDLARCRRW